MGHPGKCSSLPSSVIQIGELREEKLGTAPAPCLTPALALLAAEMILPT